MRLFAIVSALVYAIVLAGCARVDAPRLLPSADGSRASTSLRQRPLSPDSSFPVFYSFGKVPYDGVDPIASLVAANGILYGTTSSGGANYGGAVFSIDPKGKETVLHSFNSSDGNSPYSELFEFQGMFYGTTRWGGAYNEGTVYRISPKGAFKLLYSFKANYQDGNQPEAGLTAVNGTLYGTTLNGGSSTACPTSGCGTVFSITPNGVEHVLYSFRGLPDGYFPQASLAAVNGALYGTTSEGGAHCCAGIVFRITTNGQETVLHNFSDGDGSVPSGKLLYASGSLYGATSYGGSSDKGVIYKLSLSGKEKTLYSFKGSGDGCHPGSGLVNVQGNLYGTTNGASDNLCPNRGTVYRTTLDGSLVTLHKFRRGSGGAYPDDWAGLTVSGGELYGTTSMGGYRESGVVFSLTP